MCMERSSMRLLVSRNHAMENGERTRLAWSVPRPRGTVRERPNPHRLVTGVGLGPTGEGAGRNTRGRVCSPKGTASLRLGRTPRLAAALVLLALLAPLQWSSTLLSAPQPALDPKALPKFPPVAAQDALDIFQLRKGFRLELVAA